MKKLISLTLATIFAMMCLFVSVSAESNVLGDANGDGKVTATDARMVLRCATKLDTMDTILKELCDLNGDNKVTATDARLILRLATRLENADCLTNGHTITEKTTSPTCTAQGSTSKICSRCNQTIETTNISPLGHSFVSGRCTRCGVEDKPNAKLNLKWPLSEETKKIARDVFRFSDVMIESCLAEGTDASGSKRVLYYADDFEYTAPLDATINYGVSLEPSEFGRTYSANGVIEPRCTICGKLPTNLWKRSPNGFWEPDGCHGHVVWSI